MSCKKHHYQRLSDTSVFCPSCGDVKAAAPPVCALPHYPTYYPYVVPWTPTYPYWWGTFSSGSVTISDGATYPAGTSVTYTADSALLP